MRYEPILMWVELWTVMGTPVMAAALSIGFALQRGRDLRGRGVAPRHTALAILKIYLGATALLSGFALGLWLLLRPWADRIAPTGWDTTVSWSGLPYILRDPMILALLVLDYVLSSALVGIAFVARMGLMRWATAGAAKQFTPTPGRKKFARLVGTMAIYMAAMVFSTAVLSRMLRRVPACRNLMRVSPEAEEAWRRRSLESDRRTTDSK